MTFTAFIFDVANVVVDWEKHRTSDGPEMSAFLDSPAWEAINVRTDSGDDHDTAMADASPADQEMYRRYVERFDATVTGPEPGTAEVISDLLAAGYPVYGLSNWGHMNFDVARRGAPVIDTFTDLIVSGHVGMAKPDREIFELAIERFGVDPATTLFIDDRAVNCEAAAEVGLATHVFIGAGELRRYLESQHAL